MTNLTRNDGRLTREVRREPLPRDWGYWQARVERTLAAGDPERVRREATRTVSEWEERGARHSEEQQVAYVAASYLLIFYDEIRAAEQLYGPNGWGAEAEALMARCGEAAVRRDVDLVLRFGRTDGTVFDEIELRSPPLAAATARIILGDRSEVTRQPRL